jgi:hypothetical protein
MKNAKLNFERNIAAGVVLTLCMSFVYTRTMAADSNLSAPTSTRPKMAPSRSISEESLQFDDTVRSIEDSDSNFRITFQQHAAIYHLSKDGSDKIYEELQASLKKSKPLSIEVNPDSLVILSATSKEK